MRIVKIGQLQYNDFLNKYLYYHTFSRVFFLEWLSEEETSSSENVIKKNHLIYEPPECYNHIPEREIKEL